MAERSVSASAARMFVNGSRWAGRQIRGEVVRRVGGAARARVIVLFGLVLALNGADSATISAISPQLQVALHIGTTKLGLLTAISLLVGAVATIPVGMFVDKVKRIPLLSVSIVLWSIATLLSAFAGSYSTLLLTRLLLGAVVATAGPAIASLTGDYFPARERGRIYAYILGGEILGNAVGFIVSGSLASLISWRVPFVVLAIPGMFLARELYRSVPEPLRGGQSHLEPGTQDLVEAAAQARARPEHEWLADEQEPQNQIDDLAREAAQRLGVKPDPDLVLHEDPRDMTLVDSVLYVLSIPSNVLMILSSSLGYFFFSGLTAFALLFVRGHYHVGQATSELVLALLVIGALVGTLLSGWVTDALLRNGWINSRVVVPAVCYLGATVLLIPGFISDHLTPALWFDVAGAALLSAANPPLDAARLDIMPAGLWGRAESVRTVIRSLSQAAAPIIFGGLAQLIAGIAPAQAPVGVHLKGPVGPSEARGLEITFLLLLAVLAAGGVALLKARDTYARDVATAAMSHQGAGDAGAVGDVDRARVTRTDGSHTNRSLRERREWRRSNRRPPD